MVTRQKKNRQALLAIAIVFAAIAACCVMGCRPTDVLTEIIYDQSSEDVDYENENRFIVNDSSSDIENPDLASKEISDEAPANEEEQNLVIYSSDPNTVGFYTKESIFALVPEFTGFEASIGVRYQLTKDEDAVKYEVDEDELNEDARRSLEIVHEDSGEVGSGDEGDTGDAGSGGEGSSNQAGDSNSGSGPGKGTEASQGASSGGDVEVKFSNARSPHVKPPHVDHIAAFGELAVIVQAIGGEGALVAADKDLLDSDFTKVFSDEGAKNIAQGWSDDGTTTANMNVNKIINSGAQAILCYDSNYVNDLSNPQKKKLNDAGIEFVLVYELSRSEYVKQTVDTVGDMLSSSTVIGEHGKTVDHANEYTTFHDNLVSKVLDANDGKAASADGKTYEGPEGRNNSKSADYSYNSDAPYTLLIDGYDSSARFNKTTGGVSLNSSDGVLLSTLGFSGRSTSYYMQVGGVINNAATRFNASGSGKKMVVWQFATHQLRFDKDYWDNRSSELNKAYYPNSGKGWQFTLLTTDENSTASGGQGIEGTMPGSSFGTTTFPTVITTTESAKNALISNSEKGHGLYHPYDVASFAKFSYFGFATNSTLIYSCIGADGNKAGNTNVFASSGNKITSDYVKVNPHGLFTSWTEGNSMESVLECAWVNDEVKGNEDKVGWEDEVKDFYKEIYRYDEFSSSDLNKIKDGKGLE